MKKNETIAAGLNGLLTATPQEQQPAQEPAKIKGNYQIVCYSIPPDLAEKIRYIAYYDRRKLNAVVADAFASYIKQWQPAPYEKPRKL